MFAIFYYQRRLQYRQSLLTDIPLALTDVSECKKGICLELENTPTVGSKIETSKKTEQRVKAFQIDESTKSC